MSADPDQARRHHRRRHQRQTLFLIGVGLIFAAGLWYSVDEMLTEPSPPSPDDVSPSADSVPGVFELLNGPAPSVDSTEWRERVEKVSSVLKSLPDTAARVTELRQRLDVVRELLEKHAAVMQPGSLNESPAGELLVQIEYEVRQLQEAALAEGPQPAAPLTDAATSEEVRRLQAKVEEAGFRYEFQRNQIPSEQWEELSINDRLRVENLVGLAAESRDPRASIAGYEEATSLLQTAVSDLRWQQLVETLQTQPPDQALDQLRMVFLKNASDQQSAAIDDALRNWEAAAWLELARQQVEAAAPDDPGFAEMHLALAATHELMGDSAGRDDERKLAWDAVGRMTSVERAIETSIDLIESQIDTTAATDLRSKIRQTAELCGQVTGPVRRAEYYADLAGLAQQLGDAAQFGSLLELAKSSAKGHKLYGKYLGLIHHCRALSRTGTAREILSICAQVPKDGDSRSFPANAICYAHAATAAGRHGDESQFLKAALLAEIQMASASSSVDSAIPVARHSLAMADVEHGEWPRSVVSARNLADPQLRSRVLFSVLATSPEHVRTAQIGELVRRHGDIRGAASAAAFAVQHGLAGDGPAAVIDWIDELPLPSLQAAAYSGMARAAHLGWPESRGQDE